MFKRLKEANPFDTYKTSGQIESTDFDSNNKLEEDDMTSIRYRKDGRFEMRFYYEQKQYSVYSKKRTDLPKKKEEKIRQLKKQIREKRKNQNTVNDFTLKQWYEFWFVNYKKPFVTVQTASEIIGLFKNHILPQFANYYLIEITIKYLQPLLNKLPRSRKKELIITYFNACLQKAEDLEYIKKNPFKLVIREKKIKTVRKSFSIEEQEVLLATIQKSNPDFYKLILFYIATGVRRAEALEITSNDFNGQVLHIRGTKTDNADRYIKITNELKQLIFKPGKLFNYTHGYVTKKFKEYLNELKIEGTLHCLRHSYATNQYYLGTPAKQVQMQLGHADIGVTMDVYTNIVICDDKNKIIEKIKKLYNDYYIELKS